MTLRITATVEEEKSKRIILKPTGLSKNGELRDQKYSYDEETVLDIPDELRRAYVEIVDTDFLEAFRGHALRVGTLIFRNCLFAGSLDLAGIQADLVEIDDCIFALETGGGVSQDRFDIDLSNATVGTVSVRCAAAIDKSVYTDATNNHYKEDDYPKFKPAGRLLRIGLAGARVSRQLHVTQSRVRDKARPSNTYGKGHNPDRFAPLPSLRIDACDLHVDGSAVFGLGGRSKEFAGGRVGQGHGPALENSTEGHSAAAYNRYASEKNTIRHVLNLDDAVILQSLSIGAFPQNRLRPGEGKDSQTVQDHAAYFALGSMPVVRLAGQNLLVGQVLTFKAIMLSATLDADTQRLPLLSLRNARIRALHCAQMPTDAFGSRRSFEKGAENTDATAVWPMTGLDLAVVEGATCEQILPPYAEFEMILKNYNGSDPEIVDAWRKMADAKTSVHQRYKFWKSLVDISGSRMRTYLQFATAVQRRGDVETTERLLIEQKRLDLKKGHQNLELGQRGGFWGLPGKGLNYLSYRWYFPVILLVCIGVIGGTHWSMSLLNARDPVDTDLGPLNWLLGYGGDLVAVVCFGLLLVGLFIAIFFGSLGRRQKPSLQVPILLVKWVLFVTIRGGIAPTRVAYFLTALWVFAAGVFAILGHAGVIVPDDTEVALSEHHLVEVQTSHAIMKSLDAVDAHKDSLLGYYQTSRELDFVFKKDRYLTDLFHACRKNWARPHLVRDDILALLDVVGSDETRAEQSRSKASELCALFLPPEYSTFNPWFYAADVVIPLLDLRQGEEWSIRVTHYKSGEVHAGLIVCAAIEALMILIGWLLALVLAGAITGLSDPRRRPY